MRDNMGMDIYVARQPIFNQHMKLYGYELLYRKSHNNFYEGMDDSKSTASLLSSTFLVIGFNELIDGTKGFINFSQDLLLEEVPLLLPKDKVVVEILERVEITDVVVQACKKLKALGYLLALDDFILDQNSGNELNELLQLADIIKVEFPNWPIEDQQKLIKKYRKKITFLAERVETREEYQKAIQLGYSLFQGYFFSKPVIINAREIRSLDINLIRIMKELQNDEPDFDFIAGIIEKDLGLSYKLLRMANSIYFGMTNHIQSVQQALVRLGKSELLQWIHLMLLKDVQNTETEELVKTSLIRAKILALLAVEMGRKSCEPDGFLTGLFSSIDIILNDEMGKIVSKLPLVENVKEALLGGDSELRRCLNSILAFERGDWNEEEFEEDNAGVSRETYMKLYMEALKWQQSLPY
jgi:c-di-GMP-related signal transduction protein